MGERNEPSGAWTYRWGTGANALAAGRKLNRRPGKSRIGSEFAGRQDPHTAKDTVAVALGKAAENPESVPRVLATGRGEFAETILDIAFRNGIRVREDTDLAEILAAVDLDSEIPVEAFIAVAEILRYVYANNDPTADYLEQMAQGSSTMAAREDDDDGAKNGNPE